MSVDRNIDWSIWLNKLIFCHGCGRFGMPKDGKPPRGWKLLYQPHPDGRPGLYACSPACDEKLREKMKEGPIVDPLEMRPPPMPHELQEQVTELVKGVAEEERARKQEEALKRIQGIVDEALAAAMESNEGKPMSRREAIDIVANTIIDHHCDIGMAVTANVDIDENGMVTAEVVVVGKRDIRPPIACATKRYIEHDFENGNEPIPYVPVMLPSLEYKLSGDVIDVDFQQKKPGKKLVVKRVTKDRGKHHRGVRDENFIAFGLGEDNAGIHNNRGQGKSEGEIESDDDAGDRNANREGSTTDEARHIGEASED